ncbi:MAG: serpin family protein, partial [Polyangiaceae bacterium]
DLALASRSKPAADGTPGLELHVVNANWGEQTLAFEKPYLDTLAVNYGAGVRLTDFIHASEAARVNINGWVSDQTNAKIVDLLTPGSLTSDTRFVLVNAVYFKAGWANQFQAESTSAGTFHKLDGSTASVDQMSETEELSYGSTDTYETVELPYSGGQTSMVVVVPREGQFKTVEAAMTGDMLESTFASLRGAPKNVHLSLPKFTIKGGTISIRESLRALGMTDAFEPGKADFTGIGNDNLSISDVLHQAFISVDEKGTEAAAATAVIGLGGTAAPMDKTELNVNRPFFVFIRDIPTSTVLFAGRVTSPN